MEYQNRIYNFTEADLALANAWVGKVYDTEKNAIDFAEEVETGETVEELVLSWAESMDDYNIDQLMKAEHEEDNTVWIDPAGGTHIGFNDPAKLYV